MIKIILILTLIHYIGFYLFKPSRNTLSCGLFGWAGKDVKKFNKDKFDKLGILNVERGKNSCGVSFDGDIHIGLDSKKMYYDFIIDREINPKKYPVVIGHTRQSSVGVVNVHNAHPFGFGQNGEDFEFIGAHNGTLKNHKELAKKYYVDDVFETFYKNAHDVEVTTTRDKIDSEILLEIIWRSKNFKVLSEYVGGAALVFTDTTNPNVLYLFKGSSKDYTSSSKETVERPLFVYVENKNSMYFSSIEDSLKTIGGKDNSIIDIEPNVVYKITNGDFINSEIISVTRINATQNLPINYGSGRYGADYGYGYNHEFYEVYEEHKSIAKKEKEEETKTSLITLPTLKEQGKETEKIEGKSLLLNAYSEKPLKNVNEYKGVPYFNMFRWWSNGQLVTGIYTWINNYGYYYLGETNKVATERFFFYLDKVFDGKIFYDNDAFTKGVVPFKSTNVVNPTLFYFVEGIQLKTKLDYAAMYNVHSTLKRNPKEYLDYIKASKVSTHPILNLNFKAKPINQQSLLKDGEEYTGKIQILGSEKIYEISKGNLIEVKKSEYFSNLNQEGSFHVEFIDKDQSSIDFDDFDDIKLDDERIGSLDEELLLDAMINQEEEENELIDEICNEGFIEPLKDFQQIRSKLFNRYTDNNLAIKVISFIDNTIADMNSFIK
jgi:predicted glutamine amidotransferase